MSMSLSLSLSQRVQLLLLTLYEISWGYSMNLCRHVQYPYKYSSMRAVRMRMIRSARSARFSLIIRLCQQSNQMTIDQQRTSMKLESLVMPCENNFLPPPPRIISILAFPLPSEKENLNTNLIRWFFA